MSYIEQLIEALTDADRLNYDWWESFDSTNEAMHVISRALREKPDEYEISQVLALSEEDDIFEDTPNKAFKGKDISGAYQQVKKYLADAMRNKVHETLTSKVGIDSATAYADYANLSNLKEIAVKSMSDGGKKSGY